LARATVSAITNFWDEVQGVVREYRAVTTP
jgi:hypothetical protein